MNCASCEDDCHPSRITDDEHATKECQRNCDCECCALPCIPTFKHCLVIYN